MTVETEDYEDHEGTTKRRNVVTFAGYERAEGAPAAGEQAPKEADSVEDDSEEDLPF